MAAHVLILGCGRSGTSIFGELFESLPGYQYYSEPDYAVVRSLPFTAPTAIKVPRESTEFPATPGLSFPLEDLLETIPGPLQIFWQLRHPLDTICSLKVGISRNWGHHPRPLDWQEWLERPLIEQCAHHWNYLNTKGYQQVAELAILSRFEEMIANPMAFAQWVCEKIDLDGSIADAALTKWAQRVQNTNNANFVEAKTSQAYSTKDHKVKVGRWKENMTEEELEQIRPIISTTASFFDYTLED